MVKVLKRYGNIAVTAIMFIAVLMFWLCYPQALNFQEQNQLFLFSWDYFRDRVAVPGGFADYISEFIVQFYFVPWIGAVLLAILAVVMQRLVKALIHDDYGILSMLPVVTLIGVMGDENVLLSYVIAIICALAAVVALKHTKWWLDFITVPLLYWLVGPMTIVYVLIRVIDNYKKEWWAILWLFAIQLLAYEFCTDEYPFTEIMLGINYYRIPLVLVMPKTLWIVPVIIVLLSLLGTLADGHKGRTLPENNKPAQKFASLVQTIVSSVLVIVAAILSAWLGYPKDKYELLMQDYLVRNGKWQEIITRAEKYQVQDAFSSNAVNLALGMTHQLADRQFLFYQSGEDALISPSIRDNMSDLPSAEAFYQLGMINSAKRYMYDIQESIMNGRQSGRCMKRIAECFIINGQYGIAQKYLDVLKQSLFYRSWAVSAEQCLYNEAKINANPQWKHLRQVRYKKNFLYNYDQIDKMFGLLVVENKDNKLALDYFMGQMLLKGDIKGFMGYLGWIMQQGAYAQLPSGYQDAVTCIQSHGTAPASAYGSYIKKKLGVRN